MLRKIIIQLFKCAVSLKILGHRFDNIVTILFDRFVLSHRYGSIDVLLELFGIRILNARFFRQKLRVGGYILTDLVILVINPETV